MQSEGSQKENLNRIITVPNLLSFFRFCLIPVIIWSYCVKENPLLAGEILLLSGLTDLADGYIARRFHMISNLGKTGKVHGADWHGKIVTFLLYGTVAVHIIWFHITPMVSDLLIGLCAIMMVVSVVLYIIKNTRTLRGETA